MVGYGSAGEVPPQKVEVDLSLTGRALRIEFSDDGGSFDLLIATLPDRGQPVENRQIGGVGLHLLRSLVNDARYSRDGDRNRLVLICTIAGIE